MARIAPVRTSSTMAQAALGLEIGHGRIERLLDEILDVVIQRQVDVRPFLRGDFQRAVGIDFPLAPSRSLWRKPGRPLR